MSRISKEDWYFEICEVISKRSTCVRKQIGAIIVKDGRIIATGYNGAPPGEVHCIDTGCQRPQKDFEGVNYVNCASIHAEQNCILQAANNGVAIEGAIIYCTLEPCPICKKLIKGSGLKEYRYIKSNNYKEG